MKKKKIDTDVLIIGGGTSGCYAALTISRNSNYSVVIAEKANIKRSGCLAAGVNAINAYITDEKKPEDYVEYAFKDAEEIVRTDLLLSAAQQFNEVTRDMEKLGLVILKDKDGNYVTRGDRNIKINGENFKPLLAAAVEKEPGITVLNHTNMTDLLVSSNKVQGAVGFSVLESVVYEIHAKKVLIATGGAAGLYKPNNPGFSRHKLWYPPFNTGAGYAMGIKAGAEMTTFEMRFIALRCKDTIAPTGTIAQGVGARQINARGKIYETDYGTKTSERVYGTVRENQLGNGPCYLKTSGISESQNDELYKAYLNMAPGQTLKWIENGKKPSEQDVEIQGTEPYIVGGHTASGFWINTRRETTIQGLYASGDVAGGCPQKYVTGALAEGKIAAIDIIRTLDNVHIDKIEDMDSTDIQAAGIIKDYDTLLKQARGLYSVEDIEEAMQKTMDEYAGGIGSDYQYTEKKLEEADEKIEQLINLAGRLTADDMHELLFVYELKERLIVCKTVIAHLRERKETRWHSFNENMDYPKKDDRYKRYLNSKMIDGKITTYWRELVKEPDYEHKN